MREFFKNLLSVKIQSRTPDAQKTQEETQIAAAVLLLEAAHIDDECTPDELDHVILTLQTNFDLPETALTELIATAREKKSEAVDLWEFTNHINETFSNAEKIHLLEAVWRIIFVDGHMDKHEDYFAHRLTKLLRLSHKEMIEAKLTARAEMSTPT